ncbi:hypothetical protein AIOL_002177 [Candidatus Rhodobacter oscarellae]|uniref:Uncharacterized protein n=2 Tax=Candidatus Rhodobacter oscarellae TaxID=1675527 RepID=A0A0J9E2Y6_9RHOB|nr:hypothetical protein AIOL_002177 [Candidatus Rhodobacter lobularis]
MFWVPLTLASAAGPASAERVYCEMVPPCAGAVCAAEAVPLRFEIDHNQFAPPVDAKEPPRNKVTLVALGDQQFRAEPIVMEDGTLGFWAHVAGVDHLMTMRPDGLGTYATTGDMLFLTGRCEVTG